MSVPEAKRPMELEAEDGRLNRPPARKLLKNKVIKGAMRENVTAPDSRKRVRHRMVRILTEG